MADIGVRIKRKREQQGLTQEELSQKLGYRNKSTIAKIENGTNDIVQSRVVDFARALNTTAAYLMGWEGESEYIDDVPNNVYPIKLKKYPLLGEIACGEPIFCNEDRESYVVSGSEIDADFCLKAHGDSMINARIMDGDIVFIRKQDVVENGEIAAVVIDDEATLKRVYYNGATFTLTAENPKYQPLVFSGEALNHIHILGRAIAFQSDVI